MFTSQVQYIYFKGKRRKAEKESSGKKKTQLTVADRGGARGGDRGGVQGTLFFIYISVSHPI